LHSLLLVFVFLYAGCAIAEEAAEFVGPPEEIVGPPAPPREEGPSIFETIEAPRDYLSERIVAYTKKVDEFFGDERHFQESNKSVIQLGLNGGRASGGGRSVGMDFKAKLDFPAAQKRFQFVLEVSPEKKAAEEVNKDKPVATQETAKPEQYAASVRFEKVEESRWHYSLDTGAQFQFPLDPFVRSRGSYALQFEEWRAKLSETLFWFSTIGVGATTQLDMERVLREPLLFRATSTATCMESPQNCDLRQDFSFFNTLDERTILFYQASVIGISNPRQEVTAYALLMRYRYRLHKDWVFFEITPQLTFPKIDDFKANAFLLLRLEMLLGETK